MRIYKQCPVPGCDGNVIDRARSPTGLCPKHEDMWRFFMFGVNRMQKGQNRPSGLIVPTGVDIDKLRKEIKEEGG